MFVLSINLVYIWPVTGRVNWVKVPTTPVIILCLFHSSGNSCNFLLTNAGAPAQFTTESMPWAHFSLLAQYSLQFYMGIMNIAVWIFTGDSSIFTFPLISE